MIDKPLLAGVMILLTLSLVMSYSLSTYTVLHFHYTDFHFFIRQGLAILIGFVVMVILSKMDPDKWFSVVGLSLFILFFILMVAMQFLPSSLVNAVGGAKRWIHIGPISIAPVEFFKVGFVFFLAWSFARKLLNKTKMGFVEEVRAFSPYLGVFFLAVVIIAVFQKDLGQVVVLGATLLVLFLFIGSSMKFFFTLLSAAFIGVIGLIFFAPHRMARIKSWWSTVQDSILSMLPFESVQNLRIETSVKEPWQISNSLNAIHNGGFFGEGLGNGQFKLGYLSEVHTDFILAGMTEELGFFGLVLVTFTMLFIVFRIFKIASKVKDPMYYLFCIGVGLLIAFSFILNSYGISGITPIKGIAVPFLSYGGSHILASCVAIGMVLMISKKVPRNAAGEIL
ncbi:FtsW/RodA/SpoVE family cell cycle protein [Sulfurovum sp.]|uniref:FtsW/RodA/SpoVE family cell cycle protein n=1 Tax=Sulfurovum sp. TaxID=1969726 RepID=UPI0025CEC979|nr:putative peptidoglycan glycosyltransferase FtsW [Sulfurovum sp.]